MRFSNFLLASMGLLAPSLVAAQQVCFQEVVGSSGTYEQVSAALDTWAAKAYTALGLSGERDVSIGWARIPDRVSFENGCDGPFPTMADLFVHIDPANAATDYASLTAKLEAFIAANPLSSYPVISCRARSITSEIPICQTPTGGAPIGTGEEGTVCFQKIVGSLTGTYAQIDAAFQDWSAKAYVALGLTGEKDVSINWAQVPDRVSFENGCEGPYATVADLFVHIDTNSLPADDYASLSAKLEAFIAANPLTDYPAITCGARSITEFIPICGIKDAPTNAPPATTNAPAATQAPATQAPATQAPATQAPATQAPATQAPATQAPATQAPATQAPAPATTNAPATTSAPGANNGGEVPTPANVVCYQEVVGSLTGSYAQLSADLDTWKQKLYAALGLTGPAELQMGHAQIPDRVSFENGCDGPYANMADLFVHIQTTAAEYDAVSAKLEAFIAANPLTTYSSVDCMARSVVTFLPTCGKLDTPTGPSTPQNDDKSVLCFQEVVGASSASYGAVSAQLDAWEQKLYAELGLSGPLNLNMGHAQIPDRVSFENGCDGPYQSMADLFVYIPTTFGQYDALSARLEAFIAANPFNTGVISCSARSIVTELPYCGKIMNPGTPAPPTSTNGGANPSTGSSTSGQTCPAVSFTPTASPTGISVAINTPDVSIAFMDVHITTSAGFFNYRMAATSATALSFDFPAYLALGAGQSISYWFTTASTSTANPQPFACDSASYSYTTDGTPSTTTPAPPAQAGAACPSIAFDYAIERTGAGSSASSGLYAITFASATPAATVDWVDVHINANGGSFNYRMDTAATGFVQNLPSPHLELTTGTPVSYSFTYQANNVACDTATYNVVV